jgi:hypothetical protein
VRVVALLLVDTECTWVSACVPTAPPKAALGKCAVMKLNFAAAYSVSAQGVDAAWRPLTEGRLCFLSFTGPDKRDVCSQPRSDESMVREFPSGSVMYVNAFRCSERRRLFWLFAVAAPSARCYDCWQRTWSYVGARLALGHGGPGEAVEVVRVGAELRAFATHMSMFQCTAAAWTTGTLQALEVALGLWTFEDLKPCRCGCS